MSRGVDVELLTRFARVIHGGLVPVPLNHAIVPRLALLDVIAELRAARKAVETFREFWNIAENYSDSGPPGEEWDSAELAEIKERVHAVVTELDGPTPYVANAPKAGNRQ